MNFKCMVCTHFQKEFVVFSHNLTRGTSGNYGRWLGEDKFNQKKYENSDDRI
jgi:hypothetical protein